MSDFCGRLRAWRPSLRPVLGSSFLPCWRKGLCWHPWASIRELRDMSYLMLVDYYYFYYWLTVDPEI